MKSAAERVRAALDPFLQQATGDIFPAAAVHVYQGSETIYRQATGWLDAETRQIPATYETLFDLASLTKVVTATAFLCLVAKDRVKLDEAVATVLPAFSGERPIYPYEDPLRPGRFISVSNREGVPYSAEEEPVNAGEVTFRQLLTHSSGLPAWRPFYRRPFDEIVPALLKSDFAYRPGERVVYSDLGFMLLGLAISRLMALPLNLAVARLVFDRLGNPAMRFGPVPAAQAAPTEACAWRGRRIQGEVHDENAWALGGADTAGAGAAGHAGLFGTAAAVASLGQAWAAETSLADCQGENQLLPQWLAAEATSLQAEDGPVRRGLGWALWSPDPDSAGYPLSKRTFGHTGFTGTSLYVDPERELVIACLTNEVYRGRQERKIGPFRVALHERVVAAL